MKKLPATFFAWCVWSVAHLVQAGSDGGYVIQWGWDSGAAVATPPKVVATNAVAVAAGTSHALALRSDGTVFGWGWNGSRQATGLPATNRTYCSTGLVHVAGQVLSNVTAIAAGADDFCLAITTNPAVAARFITK